MARLSDADQGRLPVSRLHSRRSHRSGPGAVLRPRAAGRTLRDPGVAFLLLQESADRPWPLPRARSVHPAHQAQEHPPLAHGRGADHPPRHRVLREGVTVAQYVVTAGGVAAIVWVLWYFLFSTGSAAAAAAAAEIGRASCRERV